MQTFWRIWGTCISQESEFDQIFKSLQGKPDPTKGKTADLSDAADLRIELLSRGVLMNRHSLMWIYSALFCLSHHKAEADLVRGIIKNQSPSPEMLPAFLKVLGLCAIDKQFHDDVLLRKANVQNSLTAFLANHCFLLAARDLLALQSIFTSMAARQALIDLESTCWDVGLLPTGNVCDYGINPAENYTIFRKRRFFALAESSAASLAAIVPQDGGESRLTAGQSEALEASIGDLEELMGAIKEMLPPGDSSA